MQTTSNKLLSDLTKGDLIIPSLIKYDKDTFTYFSCPSCESKIFQIVDIQIQIHGFALDCFCFNCHKTQRLTYYMENNNFCKKVSYILI